LPSVSRYIIYSTEKGFYNVASKDIAKQTPVQHKAVEVESNDALTAAALRQTQEVK
jgi:hypothetical protein